MFLADNPETKEKVQQLIAAEGHNLPLRLRQFIQWCIEESYFEHRKENFTMTGQLPTILYYPGLTAKPYWDNATFPWVQCAYHSKNKHKNSIKTV